MRLLGGAALRAVMFVVCAGAASAGPIIIGGDDLTDHGSRSGAGLNLDGWLYIQNAIASLNGSITRTGPFTVDIAALGSASTGASYPDSNAGGAIGSVANVLGLTVNYYDGATAITTFFNALAAGTANPRIIWLPGNEATNDLDSVEGSVLAAQAAAINSFVGSGGGVLAHGAADSTAQGWLTTLLPGITLSPSCTAGPGGTLTPAGQSLFPGITNDNINAGPCHGTYSGNLGGLVALALDAEDQAFLIGGNASGGSVTDPGTTPSGDIPEPGTFALLGSGLLVAGLWRRLR